MSRDFDNESSFAQYLNFVEIHVSPPLDVLLGWTVNSVVSSPVMILFLRLMGVYFSRVWVTWFRIFLCCWV